MKARITQTKGVHSSARKKKSSKAKIFWVLLFSALTGIVLLATHINVTLLTKGFGNDNQASKADLSYGFRGGGDDTTFMEEAGSNTEEEWALVSQRQEKERKKFLHDMRIENLERARREEEEEAKHGGRNKQRHHRIGEDKKMLKKKRAKERRLRHPEEWDPDVKFQVQDRVKKKIPQFEVDFGNKIKEGQTPPNAKELAKLVKKEDFTAGWTLFRISVGDGMDNIYKMKFMMCRMAHGAYARDPASMPFFRDLTMASQCSQPANKWELSWDEAEEYLEDKIVVPPSGFIHHEARVGSTLIANMLASDERNLVYSESQPMTAASFSLCQRCSWDNRIKLMRMTVSLMGVSKFHHGLFFKLVPVSVTQIELFKAAFPDTPYIYLHREPVEVMMSLLRKQKKGKENKIFPSQLDPDRGGALPSRGQGMHHGKKQKNISPCLRPLPEVNRLLGLGSRDYAETEEYCAAQLKLICTNAADGIDGDEHGLPVRYDEDLANKFIDKILPNHFKVRITPEARERALDISHKYSKSRMEREGDYKDDGATKQELAWPELKLHAENYVKEVYDRLRKLEQSRSSVYLS